MGLGSGIRDPGSGKKPIPDPGSGSRGKKGTDPGSGSATLPLSGMYILVCNAIKGVLLVVPEYAFVFSLSGTRFGTGIRYPSMHNTVRRRLNNTLCISNRVSPEWPGMQ
jgi:hypothetical protein